MGTVEIKVRLTPEMLAAVDEAAAVERRSRESWLRCLIEDAVQGSERRASAASPEPTTTPARSAPATRPALPTRAAAKASRLQPTTQPTPDDWSAAYDRMRAKK